MLIFAKKTNKPQNIENPYRDQDNDWSNITEMISSDLELIYYLQFFS